MSPKTGSVVGGTELTFSGVGFGTNPSNVEITLGQYGCKIKTVSDTEIKCDAEVMQGIDRVDSSCKCYTLIRVTFYQKLFSSKHLLDVTVVKIISELKVAGDAYYNITRSPR